jgi:hypothetical protein
LTQSTKSCVIARAIKRQTLEKEVMRFNPKKQALIEKNKMLNK